MIFKRLTSVMYQRKKRAG